MIKTNYKYITYLIGAMAITAEGDSGETKREKIEEELLLRNVYPINPVTLEPRRTGMSASELANKLDGWRASGNWELFKEYGNLIWQGKDTVDEKGNLIYEPGDFHYVEISDWITAIYNKGDLLCGTHLEAGYAYKLGKPIYLISDVPKKDLSLNFLIWIVGSNGEVFRSKGEYLNFIDNKYNLKRKEDK